MSLPVARTRINFTGKCRGKITDYFQLALAAVLFERKMEERAIYTGRFILRRHHLAPEPRHEGQQRLGGRAD